MNAAVMQKVIYLLGLTLMFCLLSVTVAQEEQNALQTYIVWVEKPASSRLLAESNQDLESWYQSFLPETTTANSNQLRSPRMVHAYRNVATGFAAKLTPEEVREMEKKDGFVSAQAERILQLQTTHSPDFLNLHQGFGLWKQANYGEGVIIGVLDSGIGADHPSFSDEGVPPPPASWKGKCEFNGTLCNNKLIGAKSFIGAGKGNATAAPPIGNNGHGTHTSSTAAGKFVAGASVFGEANGTAVGMAPYAYSAMYQVWTAGGSCADGDILAALDAAVDDGVVVLSLPLGSESKLFYQDVIAIGAYAAIQKGIFFSCAAGNDGPEYNSLSNEAPWILTVGASTTDRILKSQNEAGADKTNTSSSSTITATILFNGTVIGDGLSPKVASFSSRGPSTASPGILKPDIIGPGVSILAAWPVSVDGTQSKATFNIISGTSMATPHLSGIAALLKKLHPDWSPAAVKSAIMTTADVLNLAGTPIVDQSLNPADVFAIGAGHVNPSRANDPGLIYDTQLKDYIPYLCSLNYTDKQIQIITQQTVNCSAIEVIPEAQLNYPSFSITLRSDETESQYYTRTLKNVGPASSTYNLDLFVPHKMGMSVNPQVLTFTEVNQELSFHVEFTAEDGAGKDGVPIAQGYLRWFSDKYNVTSPIAVVFESK